MEEILLRDPAIENAVRNKDVDSLIAIFFGRGRHFERTKDGVCHESELWDYKSNIPDPARNADNDKSWADLAALTLAFHNTRGGIIFFGINDKTFSVQPVKTRLDSKVVNEKFRKYISDRIWVEFQRIDIRPDQSSICLILVPPKTDRLERFTGNGNGFRYKFAPRESAIREGDSVKLLSEAEVQAKTRQLALPTIDNPYAINEPYYRLLRPEFSRFVFREKPCNAIERALADQRTSVVSITGIGGTGKTALGTWSAQRAFERKQFAFIVSITAKDRALTTGGILPLNPPLSNFESLLDAILDVLGYDDLLSASLEEKQRSVETLIEGSNGLLFVDNLETIDDARIIDFLDHLPVGCRAITTSRIPRIKNLVVAIDPGVLTDAEIVDFLRSYSASKRWIDSMKDNQLLEIGRAADGVPLAIEWIIKRANSPKEATHFAKALSDSGTQKDQLLEFCFRRIFDAMPDPEKAILRTLATVSSALGLEPIMATTQLGADTIDRLDKLHDDSLIQRVFDEDTGTYRFTLLPLVRSFVASDLALQKEADHLIRKRLTQWFDALDVKDMARRVVERQIRQGKQTSDVMLLELAEQAEKIEDFNAAKTLYERAYRTGGHWKAAYRLAELNRHVDEDVLQTLKWYEKAAVSAPKSGQDRALIFREYGNVLKNSGEPNAIEHAISRYEEALRHSRDRRAAHSLASLCARKGNYRKIIELKPLLWDTANDDTKRASFDLLSEAYKRVNDTLGLAKLKRDFELVDRRSDKAKWQKKLPKTR